MAKRKRLTPARLDCLEELDSSVKTKAMFPMGIARQSPPIAQVAGATASAAALKEVTEELRNARAEGRLVLTLPLEAVDETHLVRDRMDAGDAEMTALMSSLRARGQQTPIEVVELEQGRYGLISGWRRLTALRALREDTGEDRFKTVRALLRRPESASDAYLAMVEENEIRVGLSYYERARIAARATERGVYPDEASALRGLFAAASRAKRSKIGSFMAIYHALDNDLRFASAIPERLGLALSKMLKEDTGVAEHIRHALHSMPSKTAEEEALTLARVLREAGRKNPDLAKSETVLSATETIEIVQVKRSAGGSCVTLSGPGVTDQLINDLRNWLRSRV